MSAKKQYGLILSQNKSKQMVNKPSVFGEDDSSDEDEDSRRKQVNSSLRKEGIKRLEAKTTRDMLSNALTEDPTVFDYDDVYDEMQEKKRQMNLKNKSKKETKSKYIDSLKRTAELRKIEQELANERMVQKERETEGEMFSDKDAFVTPSYIRRLKERAEIEERLKKEAEIEKMNDVTKQNDLSQFYRNILDKKSNSKIDMKVKTNEDKQSIKTIELSQDVEDDTQNNVIDNVVDTEESRELSPDLSPKHDENQPKVDHSDNFPESIASVVEESQEEKRRRLFAKRTNEDTTMSAKERYLARKRAKLSQPTISTDDD